MKAPRSEGVGQEGRLESAGLAIMNSGPVHPRLCGIKRVGDVLTANHVMTFDQKFSFYG